MKITDEQRAFFDTFGFVIFRKIFPAREMARISSAFDRAMQGLRISGRIERDVRAHPSRLFMDADMPLLASLADDQRFAGVAEQLLGRPVICIQVAGHYYMADTPWHSDDSDLGHTGVKFSIYLDRLDAKSGALRLLPGSHRNPMWQRAQLTHDTKRVFGVRPQDVPFYPFESSPGDVLAFQHPLWHASFHGAPHRRMLEVNFYGDPVTKTELRAFRMQMQRNHGPSGALGRQMYPPYWRSVRNARHRRWIRRLKELGVLDTPAW